MVTHTFFPSVNENQKQKLSLRIGWYFHIFQIFSIVLLDFIFEKVGWLQNMKSNFNVFFRFYINFFIIIFTIYTFYFVEFHIRKRWLNTEYEIDFSIFSPLFFVIFYKHFHHLKIWFSSQMERHCRVSKLKQVLRSRFLMIFGHFYHL